MVLKKAKMVVAKAKPQIFSPQVLTTHRRFCRLCMYPPSLKFQPYPYLDQQDQEAAAGAAAAAAAAANITAGLANVPVGACAAISIFVMTAKTRAP